MEKFENILKQIDININNEEIHKNPMLLKKTTELLSSANSLLSKMKDNNTDIDFSLSYDKLVQYYNELLTKKQILKDITYKYQSKILESHNKKRDLDLDDNDYFDDENFHLINNPLDNNKNNNNEPIDLNFITDYNESLLSGAIKNLNKAQSNIELTHSYLKEQGDKLNNISNKTDINDENTKIGSNFIDTISSNQKCKKFLLVIINFLLFIIIVFIFINKLFL